MRLLMDASEGQTYSGNVSSCVGIWAAIRTCLVHNLTIYSVYKATFHAMYISVTLSLHERR